MVRPLNEKELNLFEGIDSLHGTDDCYGLIRKFYQVAFGIELTNYARPDFWWEGDLNLYNRFVRREGFEVVEAQNPRDWQYGDLIFMSIKSVEPCHAAIYLGDGKILHHFYGRKSSIELYKGIWHNTTVGVYRHRDVKIDKDTIYVKVEEDERIRNQLFLLEQRSRERRNNN